MQKLIGLSLVALVVATSITCGIARADDINPGIRDTGKVYSKDHPDSAWFGTGSGAREAEASALRFQVERELQDGDWDDAIKHAKRCVQFDPGDPESHFFLARALTKKFYTKKGAPDEKLLNECLYEWTLLWHHDADQWEQIEAKTEAKRLMRVAKEIRKKHDEELASRLQAKEQLAKERKENSGKLAVRPDGQADGADAKAGGAKIDSGKPVSANTEAAKTRAASLSNAEARVMGKGTKSTTPDDKSAATAKDYSEDSTEPTAASIPVRKKRFGLF